MDDKNNNGGKNTPNAQDNKNFKATAMHQQRFGSYVFPVYQLAGNEKPTKGDTITIEHGDLIIGGVVKSLANPNKVALESKTFTPKG